MDSCQTDNTMASTTHISETASASATTASATTASTTHKLKNKWNLWAHLPQDPDWTVKSYKKIYQFKTAEETIGITEQLPHDLVKNCMLFIMKDGITPMWEDPKNRNGGCFSYKVSNKNVVDVWRDLTYVLVGESISTNSVFVNCVTGITISPKKNFCIIKIWMTNCDHQNPQIVTSEIRNLTPQGCLFKKHTPEF
jgi:hypothetical protein